jgi:hypothetical protein
VDGPATLTVNSFMLWNYARMTGSGRTLIASTATVYLDMTNGVMLNERTLENAGTVIYTSSTALLCETGAVVTNRLGATWEMRSEAVLVLKHAIGAGPRFDNAGTFKKTSAGTNIVYDFAFNNYGSMELQSGVLRYEYSTSTNAGTVTISSGARLELTSGGSASGVFDNQAGGTVDWSCPYTLNPGAQLNGLGTYTNRGTLTLYTNVTIPNFSLAGTVNGPGTLTIANAMLWTTGTMRGPGRTVIAPGATLTLANPYGLMLSERILENAGTVSFMGGGSFWCEYGAVVTNRAGATWETRSDAVYYHAEGTEPRFDNAGNFVKKESYGTNIFSAFHFNNYGSMELQSGALRYEYGEFTNAGTVTLSSGTRLELTYGGSASGSLDNQGGTVERSGFYPYYYLENGAQFTSGGIYTNRGVLTLNGDVTIPNFGLSATLNGLGILTIGNAMIWTAGDMSSAGRTVIAPGAVLNLASPYGLWLRQRALENGGTVLCTGNGTLYCENGVVLTNRSGGTWEARNVMVFYDAGGGSPQRFDNAGTFRTINPGTTTFEFRFNNYGTVELVSGTLAMNGGFFSANNATLHSGLGGIGGLAGKTKATSSGQLQVGGAVSLNGNLSMELLNGYYPAPNATFTIVTAGTCSGTFANFFYPSNDVGMAVSNTANSVYVKVINVRPNVPPIADRTIDEQVLLSLNVNATDADTPTQTLTYTLTNSPAGAFVNSSGQITWTPAEAQGPMTTNISVRVTDNGTPNLTVARTFQVVVNENNRPPVLTLPPNTNVHEMTTFTATALATDPDIPTNTPLVIELVSGPPGLTVATNGAIQWDPTEAQGSNIYTVTIRVTDTNECAVNAKQMSATNSFSLTVNEVNLPPTLTVPGNQVLTEETPLSVSASSTDPDLPANALNFSLLSPPSGMTIHPTSGAISWVPEESQGSNTYTITVIVTDDSPVAMNAKHLSVTNTFTVTVNESNRPPVLTMPAHQVISEEATLSVSALASDPDLPPNPLIYALLSAPSGTTIDPGSGAIRWTPGESEDSATYTITVTVTDTNPAAINERQFTITNSFTVTVNESNRPPALTVPADQVITEETPLSVAALATDPDLPANALAFALVCPPSGMTIDPGSGEIIWTPSEAQGSNLYTIAVTVTDTNPAAANEKQLTVTNTFKVTVNESNRPPELTVPADQVLTEETLLSVSASAADPDLPTNALTFALVSPPSGMTIEGGSGAIRWSPTEAQGSNAYTITVTVTDTNPAAINERQLTVTNTFKITINEFNRLPILTLPAEATVNELAPYSASVSATDSDDPANPLGMTLLEGPAGLTLSPLRTIIWTPDETQGPSTNTVLIRVTDTNLLAINATSLSVTSSYRIIVGEVNAAPELGALSDYAVNVGDTISFAATASDDDLPANTLTFSLINPPPGATIVGSSGLFHWRAPTAWADTTNTVRVCVTDDGVPNGSATNSFAVVIHAMDPVRLTPLSYEGGQFSFSVTGPIGPDYVILASTNLVDWLCLKTNVSPTTPFHSSDPAAGAFGHRFYRLRLEP